MKRLIDRLRATSFLFLAGAVMAQTAEVAVKFRDLPDAVQRTAREQSKGLRVRGYSKETENGKTFYEVQTKDAGMSKDILLDAGGAVVEVEQMLEMSSVPGPVMEKLRRKAGAGKLVSVESVTKGSSMSYEAVVSKNGKRQEIAVDANGAEKKAE